MTKDKERVPAPRSEGVASYCLDVCSMEMITYQHKLFGIFRTASTHCITFHVPSPSCWQGVNAWLKPSVPAASYSGIFVFVPVLMLKFTLHVSDGARHFILGRVIYEVCTEPLALHATAVERFGLWRRSNLGRRQRKKIACFML